MVCAGNNLTVPTILSIIYSKCHNNTKWAAIYSFKIHILSSRSLSGMQHVMDGRIPRWVVGLSIIALGSLTLGDNAFPRRVFDHRRRRRVISRIGARASRRDDHDVDDGRWAVIYDDDESTSRRLLSTVVLVDVDNDDD